MFLLTVVVYVSTVDALSRAGNEVFWSINIKRPARAVLERYEKKLPSAAG
jgi:hypothetical protein